MEAVKLAHYLERSIFEGKSIGHCKTFLYDEHVIFASLKRPTPSQLNVVLGLGSVKISSVAKASNLVYT